MIILGVILNIVGLGVLCWALFALAIHALPFFIGTTAAMYTYQAGTGPFSAVAIGFVVGSLTFVLGQYAFAGARSHVVRFAIGLLFSVPAAAAGYHLIRALLHMFGGVLSESGQAAFALIGGIVIGSTAWVRLSILNELAPGRDVAPGSVQPSIEAITRGR